MKQANRQIRLVDKPPDRFTREIVLRGPADMVGVLPPRMVLVIEPANPDECVLGELLLQHRQDPSTLA